MSNNFSRKTISILESVSHFRTLPSFYDGTYLEIDRLHVINKTNDRDISEFIMLQLIETMTCQTEYDHNLYFNALAGTLYLLEETESFTSAGRELHTVDSLERQDRLVDTINAVFHIVSYYESCGHEEFKEELLSKLFVKKDIEYVKFILANM